MGAADIQHDRGRLHGPAEIRRVILSGQDRTERHPQVTRHVPVQVELIATDLLDGADALTIKACHVHAYLDLLRTRRRRLEDLALPRSVV